MRAWTFAATAALVSAGLVAATLPATAATPWSNSTVPPGTPTAPQTPATSSVETTPGWGDGHGLGGVTITTTATAMYSAAKPYSCAIALYYNYSPTERTYNITLTNMWTAAVRDALVSVSGCVGGACFGIGPLDMPPLQPGASATVTAWPTSATPPPAPLTSCTAGSPTPPPVGRGPH